MTTDSLHEVWRIELQRVEQVSDIRLTALERAVRRLKRGPMNDESKDLDVVGATGGKATVETSRSRANADVMQWLKSSRDHAREDRLLGEIIRICLRLDKAGFAKLYAVAKAEEAEMDARLQHDIEDWRDPARDSGAQ
jgi:hypothetical protein